VFVLKSLFVNNIIFKMFVGVIANKPSRDFTRSLRMPKG
jgi:hypothetical protein